MKIKKKDFVQTKVSDFNTEKIYLILDDENIIFEALCSSSCECWELYLEGDFQMNLINNSWFLALPINEYYFDNALDGNNLKEGKKYVVHTEGNDYYSVFFEDGFIEATASKIMLWGSDDHKYIELVD